MFNLANILTMGRIAAIPFLIALLFITSPVAIWLALVLYICIALTDWFDGWVARRFNQMSEFGRFLDPIADKILVAAMFLTFCTTGTIGGIWVILPILILTREFLVSGLREFLGPKGVVVHVTKLAKWKTATQMTALAVLIPGSMYWGFHVLGLLLLLIATVLTVMTGWEYLRGGMVYFQNSETSPSP